MPQPSKLRRPSLLRPAFLWPALPCRPALMLRLALAGGAVLLAAAASPAGPQKPATLPGSADQTGAGETEDGIAAVVNGVAISHDDVLARERLFAVSTGLHPDAEMLARLAPQITRSLIDEKLELQEIQRRRIVVPDADLAAALSDIERRNNMPAGALRANLQAQGVPLRTLIDQLRVQIGWTRVIREQLGPRAQVGDAEIADRIARLKALTGQTEYHVGEIFVPIQAQSQAAEAQRFADTIIKQLRAGAQFGVVAAQFSAAQTALQGGDLGWMRPDQLDPAVAELVQQMPPGAISNPVPVPGGLAIVTLREKREIGHEMATMVTARQDFIPFSSPLDPANPTPQQRAVLARAQQLSATAHSCDDIEAAAKADNSPRPANPGDLRVELIASAPMRQIVSTLPVGKASSPLVAPDGIMVLMVCSREEQNVGVPSHDQVAGQILEQRAELTARQLLDDLRRRAVIEQRNS